MYRSLISGIVASALGPASILPVNGDPLCHPELAVTDVHFSEMLRPTLERKWTAIGSNDATSCQTGSGTLTSSLRGSARPAPDLKFSERFAWRPPSVDVAVDFAANEAVHSFESKI